MQSEYQILAFTTLLYLFAWFPSSVGKWMSFGGRWINSNREPIPGKQLLPWASRVDRAYSNLKDYFPAFAVAIILLGLLQKFDASTLWAASLFLIGRIIHFIAYGMGNVTIRFLSFVLAMSANVFLLMKVIY